MTDIKVLKTLSTHLKFPLMLVTWKPLSYVCVFSEIATFFGLLLKNLPACIPCGYIGMQILENGIHNYSLSKSSVLTKFHLWNLIYSILRDKRQDIKGHRESDMTGPIRDAGGFSPSSPSHLKSSLCPILGSNDISAEEHNWLLWTRGEKAKSALAGGLRETSIFTQHREAILQMPTMGHTFLCIFICSTINYTCLFGVRHGAKSWIYLGEPNR